MDETTAEQLAAIVGGEAWDSGGGIWLVSVTRDDGSLVVFSGDVIAEYEGEDAFDAVRASKTILLTVPETGELYVIVDLKGNVYYLDDKMERGWKYEEDALHEARAWESRGEGRFSVVKQSELPACRAGNYEFSEKKERYFTGKDGVSPFALTTQVLREDEWTAELVGARQENLLNRLCEMWRLQRPAPAEESASALLTEE